MKRKLYPYLVLISVLSACHAEEFVPEQSLHYKGVPLVGNRIVDTVYVDSRKSTYNLPITYSGSNKGLVISPTYGSMEIDAERKEGKINPDFPIRIKVANYGYYTFTVSEDPFCSTHSTIGIWFIHPPMSTRILKINYLRREISFPPMTTSLTKFAPYL